MTATNSVSRGLCARFNSNSKQPAIPTGAGSAYGAPMNNGTLRVSTPFNGSKASVHVRSYISAAAPWPFRKSDAHVCAADSARRNTSRRAVLTTGRIGRAGCFFADFPHAPSHFTVAIACQRAILVQDRDNYLRIQTSTIRE